MTTNSSSRNDKKFSHHWLYKAIIWITFFEMGKGLDLPCFIYYFSYVALIIKNPSPPKPHPLALPTRIG